MNQNSNQSARVGEGGLKQDSTIKEVKTRLVRDYIENQRAYNAHSPRRGAEAAPIADGTLVFSVLDDQKLFGSLAVELEFQTRQLDPYCWYKQQLASAGQAVDHRNISESA